MSIELYAGDRAEQSWSETVPVTDLDRARPNVSGDLPTVFQAAPMFRRAVGGYDRFQVDTYVRWAEDELATAEREREHLVARHLSTRAALDEAQALLARSPAGAELLRVSPRIATMLATAADEAESMHAEAAAERSAAAVQAAELVARGEQAVAEAAAQAAEMLAEAGARGEEIAADAARLIEAAEQTLQGARLQAEARLEEVRLLEERAAENAERMRQQALDSAVAARLQARNEVVGMLGTAREERRRADEEAAALRTRLDREAADRRALLVAEIAALERQRSTLLAQFALLAHPTGGTDRGRYDIHLRGALERLRWRSRSLRAP